MIYAFLNPDPLLTADPIEDAARLVPGLSGVLASAELVPVTGRDEIQLLDVPAAFTSWQILLHGAVVVTPEGDEEPAWRRLIRHTQATCAAALTLASQAIEHISMFSQLNLDVTAVSRGGYPLLIRASHPYGLDRAVDAAAQEWQDWIDGGPFAADLRLLREHGTVSVLPREIGVDSAVNYVMGLLEDLDLSIGVGAEDADRPFLSLCDLALVPGTLIRSSGVDSLDAEE